MDNLENKSQEVETVENQVKEEKTTFTKEEVDAMLQQEGDRRVTAALKKQKKELEEAQKLANMSAQEKADYEYTQKIADLEKREQELARKELVLETEKQLGEKGLPKEASAFIVALDAETTKANIESFEKMFNAAVEAEITKRVATGAPKVGSGNNQAITAEQFKKMNLNQQAELYKTNPELYKALTK